MQSTTASDGATPTITDQLKGTRYYLEQVEATLKKIEQSGFVARNPLEAPQPRLPPDQEVTMAYWKSRAKAAEQQLEQLRK